MTAVLQILIAFNVLLLAAVHGAETTWNNTKECTKDEDCSMFHLTTCMSDPIDSKTRCLCHDKKRFPCDVASSKKRNDLHTKCNDDSECIENAECVFDSGNVTEPEPRFCQCKTPDFRGLGLKKCVPIGRKCTNTDECKEDVNTTCVEDKVDHEMRCLCGNGLAPKSTDTCVKDGLLRVCESDDYCPINAECSVSSNGKKLCDCKANFKRSSDNVKCDPNSAGRVAVVPAILVLLYVFVPIVF